MAPQNKYRTKLLGLRRPKRRNSGAATVASPRTDCTTVTATRHTIHNSVLSTAKTQIEHGVQQFEQFLHLPTVTYCRCPAVSAVALL
jgi:hypothetical protein